MLALPLLPISAILWKPQIVLLCDPLPLKRTTSGTDDSWNVFFFKIFGGHKSFLWGHWYPCFGLLAMSPLGFKARVDPSLVCFVACMQWIPEIHLWCHTCWLYRGQHGSWAFLIHIPADVAASIGGGSGLDPTTVRAARDLWNVGYFQVLNMSFLLNKSSETEKEVPCENLWLSPDCLCVHAARNRPSSRAHDLLWLLHDR